MSKLRSIRSYLILLVALVCAPLIGVIAWQFEQRVEQGTEASLEVARAGAREVASRLDALFDESMYGMAAIPARLAAAVPQGDCSGEKLLTYPARFRRYFLNLVVLDANGRAVCTAFPSLVPVDSARFTWVDPARIERASRPFITDPVFAAPLGAWSVLLVQPLPFGGALIGALDLDRVSEFARRGGVLKDAAFTISTVERQVVARSLDARKWIGTRLPTVISGTPRAEAIVKTTGWTVAAEIDPARVRSEVLTASSPVLAAALVMILLALAAGAWLIRRFDRQIGALRGSIETGAVETMPVPTGIAEIAAIHEAVARISTQHREAAGERDRLARIIAETSDPILVNTPDYSIVYANAAARDTLEIGRGASIAGRKVTEFYGPEEFAAHAPVARPHADRFGTWRGETVMHTVGGKAVPVSIVLIAHRDQHGVPVLYTAICRDRTEELALATERARLLEAERASRLSAERDRERLGELLEQVPWGFASLDRSWRYSALNRDGAEVLGRPPAALIGEIMWEVFPSTIGTTFGDACKAAMSGGGPRTLLYEFTPDPMRWFETHIHPARDGINLFFQERTAQKAAEDELDRFRAIVDHAAIGVARIDAPSGRLIYANEKCCAILGFERDVLLAMTVDELTFEDERMRAQEQMIELLDGDGEAFSRDVQLRRRDGSIIWAQAMVAPMWARGKPPTSYVVLLVDITAERVAQADRRRIEAQLANARRLESVGRVARAMAHDFNNMLTVVQGSAEAAESLLPEGSPAASFIGQIGDVVRRSAGMTQQLLLFAREGVFPQAAPCCLNDLVRGAMALLRDIVGDGVRIRFEAAYDGWLVRIHSSQTDQILANLAINARDAMNGAGMITITTDKLSSPDAIVCNTATLPAGDYVLLRFEDTGSGMDAATLERVFEPFFTTKTGGTGLGLASVYGIVEQCAGGIEVATAPGAGTAFTIYLPRSTEPAYDSRAVAPAAPTA